MTDDKSDFTITMAGGNHEEEEKQEEDYGITLHEHFNSELLTQPLGDDVDDDEPLPLFQFKGNDHSHRYHYDDDDDAVILLANGNDDSESSHSNGADDSGSSDDDSDSSSSSSSSSLDCDNVEIITPLQERRERNVRRNEQYMRNLKLGLNAIMMVNINNNAADVNDINNKAQDSDATDAAQTILGGDDDEKIRSDNYSERRRRNSATAIHRNRMDADDVTAPMTTTTTNNQRKRRRGMLFSKQASSASPPPRNNDAGTSSFLSQQALSPPLPLLLLTAKSISNELECKYPHRTSQIRTLTSCLVNTVRKSEFAAAQYSSSSLGKGSVDVSHYSEATTTATIATSSKTIIAPSASPIMVTGGSGCGKTHLVCDAVECLRQRSNSSTNTMMTRSSIPVTVATAYIDCASSECDSASSAMDCAYRQLYEDYFHSHGNNYDRGIHLGRSPRVAGGKKKKKMMTSKKKVKQGMVWSKMTLIGGGGGVAEEEDFSEECIIERDDDFDDDEDDSIVEDQLERQRKSRKVLYNKNVTGGTRSTNIMSSSIAHGNHSRTSVCRQPRMGRASTETRAATSAGGSTSKSPRIEGSTTNNTVQGGGGSVALFGRAISSFSLRDGNPGTAPRCCMFMILDNAERILSWRRYGSIHPLTQIFLLPSVMGIDLTLIFISQSSIFQYSPVHNSAGTISDAVHPITIHFDSYTSVDAIKSILHVPHLRRSITGSSCRVFCNRANALISKLKYFLYSSMMNSFVPSVISSTHDISEIVRLARLLWPEYVSPLDRLCSRIDDSSIIELAWQVLVCLESISVSEMQCHPSACCAFCQCLNSQSVSNPPAAEMNVMKQRLSEELDKNIRDKMRGLLSSTVMMPGRVLSMNSSPYAGRLPYTTKFLLLAAFLCQNKRAEQDINLFTTTNTGKSRRGRNNIGLAYATSRKDLTQRLQSFRLERMLSVFYSIIGQYGHGHYISYKGEGASTSAQLGTTHLFQSISMLIASKMLQISGSSKVNEKYDHDLSEMVLAKFSCTLCQDDARVIASSVGFPLKKYYP